MKLLDKYNWAFFRFTVLLLLLGTVMFYLAINWIIRHEINEKLEVNRYEVADLLRKGQPMPQFAPVVEVKPLLIAPSYTQASYSDTMITDPIENEEEPYRQLVVYETINGVGYRIINRTSLLETDELTLAIALCTAALALLLFVLLYWLNRRSAKTLWQPFQQNLATLKRFSLAQQTPITFASSDVDEFEELKTALQNLTDKVRSDYQNLKEFTANASHELQTPLAIIRSKIEWLVQSENIGNEQMDTLQAIYEAGNRLARLNQGLLLLAKIENRQFNDFTMVSFNKIISEQVGMLKELTDEKDLSVYTLLDEPLTCPANPALSEMLVKNLLENAVRHSQPKDTIRIQTTTTELVFSNPAEHAIEQPGRLFERFHRHNSSTGMGLGLALVHKICEVHGWKAAYKFQDGWHEFVISFSS